MTLAPAASRRAAKAGILPGQGDDFGGSVDRRYAAIFYGDSLGSVVAMIQG